MNHEKLATLLARIDFFDDSGSVIDGLNFSTLDLKEGQKYSVKEAADHIQGQAILITELRQFMEELFKGNAMYEHVRTLLPCDYVQICVNAAAGMGAFDDLVIADMKKREQK